jgi:hypothetical protein
VFGIRAFGAQPLPDVAPWIAYASYTAVEAMSAIVFVRGRTGVHAGRRLRVLSGLLESRVVCVRCGGATSC